MLEKLSRLNYNPAHVRSATLIPLLANRGQLVMPFYSKGSLFVKQNAHQPHSTSAKVIVVMRSRAQYNVAPNVVGGSVSQFKAHTCESLTRLP
jgi:hypothetical protein